MSSIDRYNYFVRVVADREEVWLLSYEDGSMVASTTTQGLTVPVWPEKEFAEVAAVDDWKEAKPRTLSLQAFHNLLTEMAQNEEYVGVFWHPVDLVGIDISPTNLLDDLIEECKQYED